jgi:hypothetical protein
MIRLVMVTTERNVVILLRCCRDSDISCSALFLHGLSLVWTFPSFPVLQRRALFLMSSLLLALLTLLVSYTLALPAPPRRFAQRYNDGLSALDTGKRQVQGSIGLGDNSDLCVFCPVRFCESSWLMTDSTRSQSHWATPPPSSILVRFSVPGLSIEYSAMHRHWFLRSLGYFVRLRYRPVRQSPRIYHPYSRFVLQEHWSECYDALRRLYHWNLCVGTCSNGHRRDCGRGD